MTALEKADALNHPAEATARAAQAEGRSLKELLIKFYRDWSLHTTQALTFVLITSLIPLAILLLAFVSKVIGNLNPQAQRELIAQVQQVLPQSIFATTSQDIVNSAFHKLPQATDLLTSIGLVTAVFFGTRLFTLLEACFDLIYRVPQRPLIQKNLVAMAMLVAFMVLTPILVFTSLTPDAVAVFLAKNTHYSDPELLHRIAGHVGSLLVSFFLFEIIYAFVPNIHHSLTAKLRSSVPGALTAAVALQIGLILFPLYSENYTSGVVGKITEALILLLFFYLISLVTLFGATVNAYFSEGIPPTTYDLIKRASHN
ncbi:YihY/virulence factor BrkB family protein [Tengunoibacter tsumagoiensis]|uniref:YihY/virulence factor BrkB family protein n=1 Tax=Tengunoibacter tsumagoiensis TaxID=2014871 RepID=A0A401ZUI0_9CHLR|nr:YihY/virulence factor BrkB family protein [Tengunoibacter tsumagoiensis]GCE10400.1 hypothetical protein KTT_02590 [Tengunoibacter tsumagoiensis]